MKRKCFIGIIISLNLIILNVCSVFATTPSEVTSVITAVIAALNAAEEGSARQQAVSNWIHKQSGALGFIFDLSSGSLPPATLKYLLPDPSQYENATDNEIVNACRDLILNHQTVVNNEIVLDTTLNTCIKNFVDSYVEDSTGKYLYGLDFQASQQYFSSEDLSLFSSLMSEYPNYIWCRVNDTSSVGNQWFLGFSPGDGQIYGVVYSQVAGEPDYLRIAWYRAYDVSGILHCERFTARSGDDNVFYGKLRGETSFTNKTSTFTYPWTGVVSGSGPTAQSFCNSIGAYNSGESVFSQDYTYSYGYPAWLTKTGQSVLYFSSESALQTYVNTYGVGKSAYYYNNQVWSNFSSHTTGDYTVDNSNVNTVTYGDVISYVNDYHDTNNNYPNQTNVGTWIENQNNDNNGGGSGGSGGSGDDSGGSGSGIVTILTALGKAIADLITGIAAFLAEVVGGLVEAITGILEILTDLITNFTESIPNIFSPLLGWLFDGLPEEFTAIILLGLTACVIASIIKILRG